MAQSSFVQGALPIVIVAVVVLAGAVAVALLFSSRGTYDQIGRSDLTFDREAPEPTNDPAEVAAALADVGGGEPDAALREEVRAIVEARNARRIARGQAPLDVEAEIELRLSRRDG
jgi:hypothetical protein